MHICHARCTKAPQSAIALQNPSPALTAQSKRKYYIPTLPIDLAACWVVKFSQSTPSAEEESGWKCLVASVYALSFSCLFQPRLLVGVPDVVGTSRRLPRRSGGSG